MCRKRFLFFTVLFILLFSLIFAVEAAITMWSQTYDGNQYDIGRSVVETSDGGYVIAGYATSSGGKPDVWLLKTDASGNEQWKQSYGGTENDLGYSVVEDSNGGYAIAGTTRSFGAGFSNIWLVKTDAAGNMQWNQTYGGYGGTGTDEGYSLVATSDGGYVIAGNTLTSSPVPGTSYDFLLVKTDSAGNEQWNKTYGRQLGDYARSVVETSDGGYAIAGETYSGESSSYDVLLVKTDSTGNELWKQIYGGTSYDYSYSVVQTSDGGYALAGCTDSYGSGKWDVWLIKTDANGAMQWNQTYGGEDEDSGYSLVETSDGGYAIAGYTRSFGSGSADVWLIKMDTSGMLEWDQTYGGNIDEWDWDQGYFVVETSDGGYAIVGYTETTFGTSKSDFWIIKTDESGVVPEAAWIILPLLFISTLTIFVSKKKLLHKQ